MLQIRGSLFVSLLCASFVSGCFSSGSTNSTSSSDDDGESVGTVPRESEAEALALELHENSVRTAPKAENPNDEEKFRKAYLDSFGYTAFVRREPTKRMGSVEEEALKEFQRFMSINAVGTTDSMTNTRTKSAMMRKRCADVDKPPESPNMKLWEKTTLTYRILSYPIGLNSSDVRELVSQAFKAWEIVIAMEFLEARREVPISNVDIVFEFSDINPLNKHDKTGFAVAGATSPVRSKIWIKQSERWGTFQKQEANRLDIFLTIVHEIGHILGLHHSTDQSSVMFPIFQRQVGEELPVINSDDVERLRNLYDPQNEVVAPIPDTAVSSENEHDECPSALWSLSRTPSGRLVLFVDELAYLFTENKTLIGGPQKIQNLFPGAPQRISVAIGDGKWIVLIEEKTLYAYEEEEVGKGRDGKFKLVQGYPKRLHSMVLFYPSVAFPLNNGSVILIDGNVFATYNLQENSPSFLNDKNLFFPNLPQGLRSGILDPSSRGGQLYDMFTSDTVSKYDMWEKKVLSHAPLQTYIRCK